jgi:hypothetical protein
LTTELENFQENIAPFNETIQQRSESTETSQQNSDSSIEKIQSKLQSSQLSVETSQENTDSLAESLKNLIVPSNKEDTSNIESKNKTDFENLPTPQGFATGGKVTATNINNSSQIAPSDTVPAMLTPGEFVINARDAQKNINILQRINSGDSPKETSNSQEQQETTSRKSSTKVDSFSDNSSQQKNSANISSKASQPLTSSFLGQEIGKQRSSALGDSESNNFETNTNDKSKSSANYSPPSLIFRKKQSSISTDTPSKWSSVEDLLNTGANESTIFNSNNLESYTSKSSSNAPQTFSKTLSEPKGFANGREVKLSDSNQNQNQNPMSKTIERSSPSSDNDNSVIEILAREIYNRLRQRIEIERERYGFYSGRLPW